MMDEDLFWKWFRVNHPISWFAKETGESIEHKYRLFITEFARKAYLDGRQEQKEKDAEIAENWKDHHPYCNGEAKLIAKAIRES